MTDKETEWLRDEIMLLRADVVAIRETLAEKRGERRVGLWLAGVVSTVVGAVVSMAANWLVGRHG